MIQLDLNFISSVVDLADVQHVGSNACFSLNSKCTNMDGKHENIIKTHHFWFIFCITHPFFHFCIFRFFDEIIKVIKKRKIQKWKNGRVIQKNKPNMINVDDIFIFSLNCFTLFYYLITVWIIMTWSVSSHCWSIA